ncbi:MULTISPECIES: metalloregulator ArsR/SmtB family transcription factor [unclassified Novosphingobium]|uniref:metalloregulator ArsR/SmtB family transcription factor n=1 Tax=unclassified Novosphingobium TaxID=2644732 RepID=UPI000868E29A|nr:MULTISPECIES: metalloregulator ArsR/SmtB family transcription factor [unclassified Novosphingobium]MBN9144043.1 winged helix-turn-helix transcriptional regulator [Novosphingobium sp.]MDR6709240.1 DNA-binding transcriptional ArsR family regulator [Novosphingobium sp. 1748]NKJ01681.1 DNA-binding transcriptional ArsR family regulator [Novosphingobium sp. SG707]ODU81778.1 MAG: transcriptional regulator [Novosphingobium sp. SCN 63-17]OJX95119.1 MAG: transcriptional regulator [Novosphingobium sp.
MNAIFDALSHPIRREVLELLKRGGMTAGELAEHFPVSKPTMSGHFAKLKSAGLILGENRGGTIIYTLNLSVLEEAVMGFMNRVRTGQSTSGHGAAAQTCPPKGETA